MKDQNNSLNSNDNTTLVLTRLNETNRTADDTDVLTDDLLGSNNIERFDREENDGTSVESIGATQNSELANQQEDSETIDNSSENNSDETNSTNNNSSAEDNSSENNSDETNSTNNSSAEDNSSENNSDETNSTSNNSTTLNNQMDRRSSEVDNTIELPNVVATNDLPPHEAPLVELNSSIEFVLGIGTIRDFDLIRLMEWLIQHPNLISPLLMQVVLTSMGATAAIRLYINLLPEFATRMMDLRGTWRSIREVTITSIPTAINYIPRVIRATSQRVPLFWPNLFRNRRSILPIYAYTFLFLGTYTFIMNEAARMNTRWFRNCANHLLDEQERRNRKKDDKNDDKDKGKSSGLKKFLPAIFYPYELLNKLFDLILTIDVVSLLLTVALLNLLLIFLLTIKLILLIKIYYFGYFKIEKTEKNGANVQLKYVKSYLNNLNIMYNEPHAIKKIAKKIKREIMWMLIALLLAFLGAIFIPENLFAK